MPSKQALVKLFLYSAVCLANIILFIFIFLKITWKVVFFLTLINLSATTIYLMAVVYFEVCQCFLNKEIRKKTLKFWRDHYFKYAYVMSQIVFIVYWSLCLLGTDFMILGNSEFQTWLTFYLHGIICQIPTLDLFLTDHSHSEEFNFQDFVVLLTIMILYTLMQIISKYWIEFYIYPFLKWFSFNQLVVMYLIVYLIAFNVYQLYIKLLKKKAENSTVATDLYIATTV